ncbi:Regulatory phage protein cox [Serratia ficaria]|uniref:regulatory phage cox family protein n=1 Tax=Serratia ficaria TaxID=61651 RepID=UPI002182C22F|nr:regulatory phage cox family protein [Serratia ficaria]CAI2470127.1 Regulatory phage protein cox [Serratia ficaria]CAI2488935.1 Regulatory phage protein cox [Serratia ficaria]
MQDGANTTEIEQNAENAVDTEEGKKKVERKRAEIKLSEDPSQLLSKEGFALYVGKTAIAVVSMAKAGKLPAFYMTDPLNPGGHAELWIHRGEWDKYAEQLVENAPDEWHGWKDRLHHSKPSRRHARAAA